MFGDRLWGDATWPVTPAFSDELLLRCMDDLQGFQHTHRRGPHGKRLFKHGGIDSPLYDASGTASGPTYLT